MAQIDLQRLKSGLIDREDFRSEMLNLISVQKRCQANLNNAIAAEFCVWLSDPQVRELPAEDLKRRIRRFVDEQTSDIMDAQADQIETSIERAE